VADRGTKVPLYFHPPTTTSNSRKIITPTIEPTDILLIRPLLLERFVNYLMYKKACGRTEQLKKIWQ